MVSPAVFRACRFRKRSFFAQAPRSLMRSRSTQLQPTILAFLLHCSYRALLAFAQVMILFSDSLIAVLGVWGCLRYALDDESKDKAASATFTLCVIALPFLIVPTVKGSTAIGGEFCNSYWRNQTFIDGRNQTYTNAQLGGQVCFSISLVLTFSGFSRWMLSTDSCLCSVVHNTALNFLVMFGSPF
jgi:hypothetical protein